MDLSGDPQLCSIKGIAILDNDGNRILAKYFDSTFASVKEQKAFEKSLFTKTHNANGMQFLLIVCYVLCRVDERV